MFKVSGTQASFEKVKHLFLTSNRVFYSRFRDGDVYIMMGRNQANHDVTPLLQKEMIKAFEITDPLYLKALAVDHPNEKGMVRGLFANFRANTEMKDFLQSTFHIESVSFENPVFLHYMAVFQPQLVNNFLNEVIRPKRKMFVGSIPKEKIETIIGPVAYYVETPSKNAYASIDEWWPKITAHLHDVELIIPAAGMATRVINMRLWHQGTNLQSFDIGSLVDIADTRKSRKWIRLAGHRIERHILRTNQKFTVMENLKYLTSEFKLICYSIIKSLS